MRDLGLAITVFQPFRDFEGMPEPQRARAFDRAERKFDLMQELGTDLMLVCSNVSPRRARRHRPRRRRFPRARRARRQRGACASATRRWPGARHVNDHRDAWEIVRRADHPNVGLILDSFHTLARGSMSDVDPLDPGDKIFIVQLADAPLIDMDSALLEPPFPQHAGPGRPAGRRISCEAVAATGYDGYLSLEIFNDQFRGGSAVRIAVDGRRSLIYLGMMSAARRRRIRRRSCAERRRRGVEFVEFAADEEEAGELAALFRRSAFASAARIASKDVERCSQGDINLVINTEREGFAHSLLRRARHVGLRHRPQGRRCRRRWRGPGRWAPTFEQPVGPGELTFRPSAASAAA